MDWKKLAGVVADVVEQATGTKPIIDTITGLGGYLKAIGNDLSVVPNDPATGQPATLAYEQNRVALAVTKIHAQDALILANAKAALAENAGGQ